LSDSKALVGGFGHPHFALWGWPGHPSFCFIFYFLILFKFFF
jgi:hypothetical protein